MPVEFSRQVVFAAGVIIAVAKVNRRKVSVVDLSRVGASLSLSSYAFVL